MGKNSFCPCESPCGIWGCLYSEIFYQHMIWMHKLTCAHLHGSPYAYLTGTYTETCGCTLCRHVFSCPLHALACGSYNWWWTLSAYHIYHTPTGPLPCGVSVDVSCRMSNPRTPTCTACKWVSFSSSIYSTWNAPFQTLTLQVCKWGNYINYIITNNCIKHCSIIWLYLLSIIRT